MFTRMNSLRTGVDSKPLEEGSLYMSEVSNPHALLRQRTMNIIPDMDDRKIVIGQFLNDAIPTKRNQEQHRSFLQQFASVLFQEHDLVRMFAKPSLSEKRVTRYVKIFLRILLILFLDTLFFGQFFPDAGFCNSQLSENTCSASLNKATGSPTCRWMGVSNTTISGDMKIFDTSCKVQYPPNNLSFIFIVALLSLILGLPLDLWFNYLLMDVCARRPDLEKWGIASARWLGTAPLEVTGDAYPTDIEVALHPEKDVLAHKESMKPVPSIFIANGNNTKGRVSGSERMMHHRLLRNNMLSEQDYVSLLAYINHMSPSSEADLLVNDVREIIERGLLEVALPWKTAEEGHRTMQQIEALTARLGVHVDGSPMPLTLRDRMRYSSQRHRLEAKIVHARQKATSVINLVTRIADVTSYEPSIALIHVFVTEHFTPFKRFILEHQFFPHHSFYSASIDPGLWLLGVIGLTCSILFFLYWILAWAVGSGHSAFRAWGVNFILIFMQEMMIIQVVEVLIFHFLGMYAIEPQLVFIYRALYKVAVDIAQNKDSTPTSDTTLVQHLSPACRAAHASYIRKLPASKILRRVKDEDIQLFRKANDMKMYPLILVFVLLPMLLAFAGRSLSRMMIQTIIPAGSYLCIVGNYYLYRLSTYGLIFLYVALVVLYSYRSNILQPAVKDRQLLEQEKLEAKNKLILPTYLRHSTRKQSLLSQLKEQIRKPFVYLAFTLPTRLRTYIQGPQVIYHQQGSTWKMMNKPALLQARQVPKMKRKVAQMTLGSDNNKVSLLQTINVTQFNAYATLDKSLELVMKSTLARLPPEITGLRKSGWDQGWHAQSSYFEEYNDPIILRLRKQLNLVPQLQSYELVDDNISNPYHIPVSSRINLNKPALSTGRQKSVEGLLLEAISEAPMTENRSSPTQQQLLVSTHPDHLHETMSMFMKELVEEEEDENYTLRGTFQSDCGSPRSTFSSGIAAEPSDTLPAPFLGDSSPTIMQKSWEQEHDSGKGINKALDDLRDLSLTTNKRASERVLLFKLRHRRTNNPLLAINQILWSTFQPHEKQFDENELPESMEHSIAFQLVRHLTNLFEPQLGAPLTETESVEFVKGYVRWVRTNQLQHDERIDRQRVVQWIVEYWSTRTTAY